MKTLGGKVSIVGSLLVIVASMLPWTTISLGGGYSYRGTSVSPSVFFDWGGMDLAASFLLSAGMAIAVLGIVSLLGVLLRRPALIWLGGGVVTLALALLIVRFFGESDPDFGLLIGFVAGLLILVGAFLDRRAGSPSA